MKQLSISLYFSLLLSFSLSAQPIGAYNVVLEEVAIADMPGLQSFATGQYEGEWLLIGGRTDGLHRRQPWATFWEEDNNKKAYILNPETQEVWSANLSALPTPLFEQLQSTNMEFQQVGDILYLVGGYGYSPTAEDHITHPRLVAIDLSGLIPAIKAGEDLEPHFQYITDERFRVTGGHLGYLFGEFYLVGGQNFEGRYNPMGPSHGPGFVQEYTNEIRRFQLAYIDGQLTLTNYSATKDTANLHRRDYNMLPQIFPGGQPGFTAFSGVFQYEQDLPWLNTVDITPDGYTVNNDFSQFLNQYHTAHVPLYDPGSENMYSLFFGGISRYTLDTEGNLVDDTDVPFVKTVSLVTRDASGQMTEVQVGEMPALLGSSAEFLLRADVPLYNEGVVDLSQVEDDTLLLGYIAGGIESSQPNIFWINDGNQSEASSRIFRVYLVRESINSLKTVGLTPEGYFDIAVFPNPTDTQVKIEFNVHRREKVSVTVIDSSGREVKEVRRAEMTPGRYQFTADCGDLSPGLYHFRVSGQKYTATEPFTVK